MQTLDSIKSIRKAWLNRVVQSLARGAGVREDFREQLDKFYGLLEQVVETGDKTWLDPILSIWANSLTESDLEEELPGLTSLIGQISQITFEVCRDSLESGEALEAITSLSPCLAYASEKAAQFELNARVNYINTQLSLTKQALERLEKSKADFIAVAAHELKTPLTLVEGYTSMLKDNLAHQAGGPNSQAMVLVEGIKGGTARLRTIIDDMIDVSQIDNNLLKLNFQPLWVNRLLSVIKAELKETTSGRSLSLDIRPFEGSGDMTFGDPERLMQVFRNIVTNAVKFTPDGGSIVVDGRRLPGFVEVTVTDTGIGIDIEDLPLIFEKFGRLGNTSLHSSGKTKFKGGGPGLGLHIAKGIIEAHGGAIWVESDGRDETTCPGTTFHILLPIRQEPPDENAAKAFAPLVQQKISQT